jgi:RNA polymerase sigma-70 factor (ECF subfamily)
MNNLDDEFAVLMSQVRRDNEQALAALIALYEPEIRRAAQGLLGRALRSSLDPTDLVQSVHLQLILGLKQAKLAIASPQQLRSLALMLLRHKFIQHWRHHRCQARHNTFRSMTSGLMPEKITTVLHQLDPVRVAEYNDLLDHLFRHLGIEDRRLVVMRLEGYRTTEIATELGIDPAALRVRLSRLRKRLRQEKPLTEWV